MAALLAPVAVRGYGQVRIVSPGWWLAVGDLPPGAARTVRVVLDVPATVREFMLVEAGLFWTTSGTAVAFADSQILSR